MLSFRFRFRLLIELLENARHHRVIYWCVLAMLQFNLISVFMHLKIGLKMFEIRMAEFRNLVEFLRQYLDMIFAKSRQTQQLCD